MISREALDRFFRTPKGLLLIVLVVIAALAAPFEGIGLVWPGVAAAMAVAAAPDAPILYFRGRPGSRAWDFPSGAVLTGLLIAMVLSPREPWYVDAAAAAIAVSSKYVLRTKAANVFNPAALALVIVFYVFHTAQNWWGALPENTPMALVVLLATGLFIADRVNRMPLVLVFLGTYYALFSLTALLGDARMVSELYRSPDLQAALFFAFFILTDPPTSPVRNGGQIVCGILVAVASYVLFERVGAAYFLLGGVLAGNLFEAWRQWSALRRRIPAGAAPAG